ncbi:MAG: rod shape-determining protein MreD [Leptospirales bacterium]
MIFEKLIIAVAIIVSYFMQTSMDFFKLGAISPDFLMLLTIYFAVHRGEFAGMWVGFFGGLLQDINFGTFSIMAMGSLQHSIGMNVLPKSIVGYIAGKFSEKVRKDNILSLVLLVFGFSILKGLVKLLLTVLFSGSTTGQAIITVILPESLYNALLSIVWFKLLFWAIPPVDLRK